MTIFRRGEVIPSSNQLRRSRVSVAFHVVDIFPQDLVARLQCFTELLGPLFVVRKHLIDYLYDQIGRDVQSVLQSFAFRAKPFEVCFSGGE